MILSPKEIDRLTDRGFTVGLDLGQSQDFTALAVIETRVVEADVRGGWLPHHDLRHIQRLPLGTAYDSIAEIVGNMVGTLRADGRRADLVVDATGVGRPVIDLLRRRRLKPIGVTISGGKEEQSGGDFAHSVPKRNLVSALVIAFQGGTLKMAAELPAIELLRTELVNFKAKINVNGHEQFEAWRDSVHDDLVLSTALAVWWAERKYRNRTQTTELRI